MKLRRTFVAIHRVLRFLDKCSPLVVKKHVTGIIFLHPLELALELLIIAAESDLIPAICHQPFI
jgi:hypothetical protein